MKVHYITCDKILLELTQNNRLTNSNSWLLSFACNLKPEKSRNRKTLIYRTKTHGAFETCGLRVFLRIRKMSDRDGGLQTEKAKLFAFFSERACSQQRVDSVFQHEVIIYLRPQIRSTRNLHTVKQRNIFS